jgi:uncharacterized protein with GYD domain
MRDRGFDKHDVAGSRLLAITATDESSRDLNQQQEEAMAHYLLRWQFKDATAKVMIDKPQDRTGPATNLIEGFGGKLLCYYFALGEYDGIGICEFPDHVSVAACSMKAAATGAFARFETMALLTATEAESAMKKAKDSKVNYSAPNA